MGLYCAFLLLNKTAGVNTFLPACGKVSGGYFWQTVFAPPIRW
jgi:hypothetical protein